MESNSVLLRALVAASSGKMAGLECPVSHESGVPRSMKMGTIASPWRHDEMRQHAPRQPESRREAPGPLRHPTLFHPFSLSQN
jgi:hypothetical protein